MGTTDSSDAFGIEYSHLHLLFYKRSKKKTLKGNFGNRLLLKIFQQPDWGDGPGSSHGRKL